MQSLQELEHLMECILTVALSQTLESFEKELDSQISYTFVNDIIKDISNFPKPDEQCSTFDEIDFDMNCCTRWIEWS